MLPVLERSRWRVKVDVADLADELGRSFLTLARFVSFPHTALDQLYCLVAKLSLYLLIADGLTKTGRADVTLSVDLFCEFVDFLCHFGIAEVELDLLPIDHRQEPVSLEIVYRLIGKLNDILEASTVQLLFNSRLFDHLNIIHKSPTRGSVDQQRHCSHATHVENGDLSEPVVELAVHSHQKT